MFAEANKKAIAEEGYTGQAVLQESTRRYKLLGIEDQFLWTSKAEKEKQEVMEGRGEKYTPGKKLLALQLALRAKDKPQLDDSSDDEEVQTAKPAKPAKKTAKPAKKAANTANKKDTEKDSDAEEGEKEGEEEELIN